MPWSSPPGYGQLDIGTLLHTHNMSEARHFVYDTSTGSSRGSTQNKLSAHNLRHFMPHRSVWKARQLIIIRDQSCVNVQQKLKREKIRISSREGPSCIDIWKSLCGCEYSLFLCQNRGLPRLTLLKQVTYCNNILSLKNELFVRN